MTDDIEFEVGEGKVGFDVGVTDSEPVDYEPRLRIVDAPEEGFPLKVESLEPTLTVTLWRNRRVWIGEGEAPRRYVPWLEWLYHVFGIRRWRYASFGDKKPMVEAVPRSRLRRAWEWVVGCAP